MRQKHFITKNHRVACPSLFKERIRERWIRDFWYYSTTVKPNVRLSFLIYRQEDQNFITLIYHIKYLIILIHKVVYAMLQISCNCLVTKSFVVQNSLEHFSCNIWFSYNYIFFRKFYTWYYFLLMIKRTKLYFILSVKQNKHF